MPGIEQTRRHLQAALCTSKQLHSVVQYLGDLGCEHVVFKNDEKTVEELRALNPRGILLSPGPGISSRLQCCSA